MQHAHRVRYLTRVLEWPHTLNPHTQPRSFLQSLLLTCPSNDYSNGDHLSQLKFLTAFHTETQPNPLFLQSLLLTCPPNDYSNGDDLVQKQCPAPVVECAHVALPCRLVENLDDVLCEREMAAGARSLCVHVRVRVCVRVCACVCACVRVVRVCIHKECTLVALPCRHAETLDDVSCVSEKRQQVHSNYVCVCVCVRVCVFIDRVCILVPLPCRLVENLDNVSCVSEKR